MLVMDKLRFRGKLKWYLLSPVLTTFIFLVLGIIYMYVDFEMGWRATMIVGIIFLINLLIIFALVKGFENELINYAVRYGTVQKELLEHFQLPYALLDGRGQILWVNKQFTEITGKSKDYHKSITSLFSCITRESINKNQDKVFNYNFEYNGRHYRAVMNRLFFKDVDNKKSLIRMEMEDAPLLSCMLFDETELVEKRKAVFEQRMVTGLVYIDNYDETFDKVEDVKKSLLTAMIDRKITTYFAKRDAVVRKLDKDRYFVVFCNKYLQDMEDDKFSILEEIKTTKGGNENEITLSIGIGCGEYDYLTLAEFARTAVGLAMGRGGSQAVVKDGQDVSYYGIRGREVEKSSRVKARVKAQSLREMMTAKEKVICMGHQISDVDALGSAIGVYCAARELGKKCQIVLNTVTTSLRPFVDLFSEENGYPPDLFIESYQAREMLTSNTLVVVVDTNRPSYTECPDLLERSHSIVVFDHHRQGKEQIVNPLLSYIEPYASSACEMIAEVLQYFSEKIQLAPAEADCIYAGILIDTNNYMTKTGVRTFEAAAYLRRCGAEVTRVRKLLRENMDAYKARAEVVRHAEVYKSAFAISYCPNSGLESPTIVSAQAANELLNIVGIKASFVMTEYNGKMHVSARSIDEIDVQKIMERLGGGGHLNVAGAQITGQNADSVSTMIKRVIDEMIIEGEIKI